MEQLSHYKEKNKLFLKDFLQEKSKQEEIKNELANLVEKTISKYIEEYFEKNLILNFESNVESKYINLTNKILRNKKKSKSETELIKHLNIMKFLIKNYDISDQFQKYLFKFILQEYLINEVDKNLATIFKNEESEESLCLNQVSQQSLMKLSLMKTVPKKKKTTNQFQMN